MDLLRIKNTRSEISSLLDHKRLKQAFVKLKQLTSLCEEWHFGEKIAELESSYQLMLTYMEGGALDPDREKLYRKFLADAYTLTDLVTNNLLSKETNTVYFSKHRFFLASSDTLQTLFNRFDHLLGNLALQELSTGDDAANDDAALQQLANSYRQVEAEASVLFYRIWTSFPCTAEDYVALNQMLSPGTLPIHFHALFISALTLSLMEWYDEKKLLLLINNIENKEPEIRQRALIGSVLILQYYPTRAGLSDTIAHRLDALFENERLIKELHTIQMHLIRARETEKITRRLNEEILPEMLKINPSMGNKLRSSDTHTDLNAPDYNPEWEELLNQSGIGDKLKELSDLQTEGSDVLMSAFSSLKGFPFFAQTSNWFLPFFDNNSQLLDGVKNQKKGESKFLKIILNSRLLCNSDKYSFFMSLQQVPPAQREMMAAQFNMQNEAFQEIAHEEKELSPNKNVADIANQYIHDLYRFFKLNPRKYEFSDPFEHNLNLFENPQLKRFFADTPTLLLIGELLFRKEFHTDALLLFRELVKSAHSNHEIYQKMGYSYEEMGDFVAAVESYKQAELIRPDSLWTLKRIAFCYRYMKRPAQALEYYLKVEKRKPNNLTIEINIGHCYLELKEYENALNYYFKVDYLSENKNRAWRPIAWCSFLVGKFEQAQRYYQKIIAEKPTSHDYINAGHTEWLLGSIQKAIQYYKKSIDLEGGEFAKFEKIFTQDIPDLRKAGISEWDIPLMIDQILYSVNKG